MRKKYYDSISLLNQATADVIMRLSNDARLDMTREDVTMYILNNVNDPDGDTYFSVLVKRYCMAYSDKAYLSQIKFLEETSKQSSVDLQAKLNDILDFCINDMIKIMNTDEPKLTQIES